MVVKRQKSDANLSDGKEVVSAPGKSGNGSLIQAVRLPSPSWAPPLHGASAPSQLLYTQ